jgi:hypothetical protein
MCNWSYFRSNAIFKVLNFLGLRSIKLSFQMSPQKVIRRIYAYQIDIAGLTHFTNEPCRKILMKIKKKKPSRGA